MNGGDSLVRQKQDRYAICRDDPESETWHACHQRVTVSTVTRPGLYDLVRVLLSQMGNLQSLVRQTLEDLFLPAVCGPAVEAKSSST